MQSIKNSRRFLAIDLETTGLDPEKDYVLEVGWFVLDGELNPLTTPKSKVVKLTKDEIEHLFESRIEVRKMHAETGLIGDLFADENREYLHVIENEIIDDIENNMPRTQATEELEDVREEVPVHLLGSSVHFDRAFISNVMSMLDSHLHHRILDVTSLVMAWEAATGKPMRDFFNFNSDGDGVKHRALHDINESYHLAEYILEGMGS